MTIEFVTIGEVTVDDTVLETGQVMRAQTGGGTVYSALGIRLWHHQTGINAVIGKEYPAENLRILEAHAVSTEGITRIDGWSLRLWLLHEENSKKQQFPKLQSSTFQELDELRADPPESYWHAKGYHLAPATPEGQMRSRDVIRQKRPETLISLDILAESFIQLDSYRDGSALQGIDIFSPSIVEIEKIWPGQEIEDVIKFIAANGVRWIAIKMDIRGSIVYDTAKKLQFKIPIYPAATVDETGAGDAYSGGFLEGLAETEDILEAGIRGTVSASFAVEDWGAFGLLSVDEAEIIKRKNWLHQNLAAGDTISWS